MADDVELARILAKEVSEMQQTGEVLVDFSELGIIRDEPN